MMENQTRLICVNCGICVNRLKRHLVLQLDFRVISLLAEWISPTIITESDHICEACWSLAMRSVNEILHADNSADMGHAGSSQHCVGHHKVCIFCGRSILKRQSNIVLKDNPTELESTIINYVSSKIAPREISPRDCLCQPCWLKLKRSAVRMHQINEVRASDIDTSFRIREPVEATTEETASDINIPQAPQEEPVIVEPQIEQPRNDPTHIVLNNYRRSPNTASHCVFLGCTNNVLHRIPDTLRATVLQNHKFYMPSHVRVCSDHISNSWEILYDSENSLNTFTTEQVEHVFSFVNTSVAIDFNNINTIDEHLFQYWLSLSKENFEQLLNEVPRIQTIQRGILGLISYLIKLRTGDSDERISSLVNVPRRSLEGLMSQIREVLLQDFVPINLGIQHMPREQLLKRNLIIPNGIYNSRNTHVIIIADGTYIYTNKSSNYMFQKDTYSLHKYRNLLKPFLLVTCDGYIVDCFGPYKATTSDADIIKSLFRDRNSSLSQYFQEGDIFILDRGFRDSVVHLQRHNYRVYTPESLLEGQHQLTTEQANETRCVTLCRWVVEVVNGYFKRDFKLLRQNYFNRSLPHMMQDFQIAASILNRFGKRLRNRPEASEIVNIINQRRHLDNRLANIINASNFNRRSSNFVSITADRNNLLYFPQMEYRDLILFALGTYQIKQARSYYGEHVRFHEGYRIEVSHEPNLDLSELNLGARQVSLIRGRIKSRHVGRKQYFVYILVDNNISGRQGIIEYCCNCLAGRRTLGCCAHVMTLVWYLGWARHQQNIHAPAGFLDDIVIIDDMMQ